MDGTTEAALGDLALLKPRQSLQNIGEKKKEEETRDGSGFQAFGADGFTFLDFLDIVNPLQHIPVVSNLYREMTGDEIDPGSRIAGGTLFGGPIGAIVASANVALNEATGKDMGDYVVAFLSGGEGSETSTTKLANAQQEKGLENAAIPAGSAEMAGLEHLSPIATNMEVLQWARRETALMATTHTSGIKPPEETRPQSAESKKTAERAVGAKMDSYDIADNAEVLGWARTEALLARNPGLAQGEQALELEQKTLVDPARQKAVAAGLTQEQLTGAAAPAGGWFSETMLLALASYQDSAGLGKPGTPGSNVTRDIGALDLDMNE